MNEAQRQIERLKQWGVEVQEGLVRVGKTNTVIGHYEGLRFNFAVGMIARADMDKFVPITLKNGRVVYVLKSESAKIYRKRMREGERKAKELKLTPEYGSLSKYTEFKPTEKEPWMMTREEWLNNRTLKEGKPVPRHVLEEYKGEKWADEALAKREKQPWEMTREEFIKLKLKELIPQKVVKVEKDKATGNYVIYKYTPTGRWEQVIKNRKFLVYQSPKIANRIANKIEPEIRREIEDAIKRLGYKTHLELVTEALIKEGKPVPSEVLKDYPDLAEKYLKSEVTPPTKPAETPKGEKLTIKTIPKELEPLAKEARKYKSAEEFVAMLRIKSGDTLELIDKLKLPLTGNERFSLRPASLYRKSEPEKHIMDILRKGLKRGYNLTLKDFYNLATKGVKETVEERGEGGRVRGRAKVKIGETLTDRLLSKYFKERGYG